MWTTQGGPISAGGVTGAGGAGMAAGGWGPLAPDGRLPFGASGRPGCLFPFCEGRARALAAGKLAAAPGEGLGSGLLSGRGTSLDAADCAWEGAGAASLATPVRSLFTARPYHECVAYALTAMSLTTGVLRSHFLVCAVVVLCIAA